jgi:hypothetical protein
MLGSPDISDEKLEKMAYLYYSIVVGENGGKNCGESCNEKCNEFAANPTSEGINCDKFANYLTPFPPPLDMSVEEPTTTNDKENLKTGSNACPCEIATNQYSSDLTGRKERVVTPTPSQSQPATPQPVPLTGAVAAESGVSSSSEVDRSTAGGRETNRDTRFSGEVSQPIPLVGAVAAGDGGGSAVVDGSTTEGGWVSQCPAPHREGLSMPTSPATKDPATAAPATSTAPPQLSGFNLSNDFCQGKVGKNGGAGAGGGIVLDGREWGWRWRLGDGLYFDSGLVLKHSEAVRFISSLCWDGSEEDDIFLTFDSVPPIGTPEEERFDGEEPDFEDDDLVDEFELWWIRGFPRAKEVVGSRPSRPVLVWARNGYRAQKWLWSGRKWVKVGEYDFQNEKEREAFRRDRDQPRVGCFGLTRRGRKLYLWFSDKSYRWIFVGSCYFDPAEPVKFFLRHDPRRMRKRERREICTKIHPLRSWAFLPSQLNAMGACAKCGDYYPKLRLFSVPKVFEYKIRRFQRKSNWKTSVGSLVLMFNGYRVCDNCMRQILGDLIEFYSRLVKNREIVAMAAIYTGLLDYNPEWEEKSPWLAFFYRLRHWTQFMEFRFRTPPSEFVYIDEEPDDED